MCCSGVLRLAAPPCQPCHLLRVLACWPRSAHTAGARAEVNAGFSPHIYAVQDQKNRVQDGIVFTF